MATKPFDPTLKVLVETVPEDWPELAGLPSGPTTVIDSDIATVSGAADKVLQVDAAVPYLLHLEFVTGHDAATQPGIVHVRNALLGHRHGRRVWSVVVLLRPEADSPTLTGELAQGFPGESPYDVFRYQVIRVWQLPPAQLLAGGIGTLPLAPISAVTEPELPGIIKQMQKRLSRRRGRRLAETIWNATYILLGLRYSSALAGRLLREVTIMKESTTYQAILAEGARKLLLLQGKERFGPPDASTTEALESITEVERLEALGVELLRARSWQDLLGRPKRRRNGQRARSS